MPRKTAKPSKTAKKKATIAEERGPRPQRLPGLEDPAIQEIETAALDYVEVRDKRQKLTLDETSLKTELLAAMKKHGKTKYVHDGVEVEVVVESETVKVRKRKAEQAEV